MATDIKQLETQRHEALVLADRLASVDHSEEETSTDFDVSILEDEHGDDSSGLEVEA